MRNRTRRHRADGNALPRPFGGPRGFTLVELVVVLGVIAVMAAVIVPIYVSKLPEMRLKSAARSLVGDLRYARSLAVADDTPYFVCFSGTGAYQIDRVDNPAAAADCASADTPTALSADLNTDYPNVKFGYVAGLADCPSGGGTVSDSVVFTSDRAVFNAKGASMTGSGAGATVQGTGLIYLTNTQTSPQLTYCIEVRGAVGNIRLLNWNATSSTWVQ